MKSFILIISARVIVPVMLIFSVFLLFRGHNLPGGGFIGGLTAGAAFVLHAFAFGMESTFKALRIRPVKIIAIGLLLSFLSGVIGLVTGEGLFKGYWLDWDVSFLPKLGSPFLFDVGVYVLVMGIVMVIIFPNIQEDS
ncbi:Na+/H+ antiporter subunit B [Marivirga sp. S37H4]|uniref:Na+/H+ antiporter subunit B n=1 Tax=Marivirga aurantiaca TaxID=2802615 RepID=A0A934WXY9_9BACT|nr:Na+/H+ antiporter subunit B [Marivirga aurantiaca]MBK6264962.1 Na+/H+ antiporter subunit B [Marivirga aurantiaca]